MTHFTDFGDPNWLSASDITFNNMLPYHHVQIQDVIEAYQGIGYVAGGAARNVLVPGAPEPADIDVFLFGTEHDVSPLYEMAYHLDGGPERAPFYARYDNQNPGHQRSLRVQVIQPDPYSTRKTHGMPLEVLSSFTFHTEQFAIWHGAGGPAGLLSVLGRESTEERMLTNNVISNPILSMYRLNKYGQKGYGVSMNSVHEIVSALRDLTDDEYDAAITDALSMVS